MPDTSGCESLTASRDPRVPFCKGGAATCETCVGSCGIEEYEEQSSGSLFSSLRERADDRISRHGGGGMGVSPYHVLAFLDAYDALEKWVAAAETNSEAGAPDYAHEALRFSAEETR